MVKLTGFERVMIEEFKHEPETYDAWHFWVTVYEASYQEYSESIQRLKPSELESYHAGNLRLMVVKLEAYCDPRHLGSWISEPVWVRGNEANNFSQGSIRGESCRAIDSAFMRKGEREAIQNGMECLSVMLGSLKLGEARDQVERAAGIR